MIVVVCYLTSSLPLVHGDNFQIASLGLTNDWNFNTTQILFQHYCGDCEKKRKQDFTRFLTCILRRGQILPLNSLKNIIDVGLIYEGFKYIIKVSECVKHLSNWKNKEIDLSENLIVYALHYECETHGMINV